MFLDVVDLRNFYSQPLGIVARRLLSRAIRERWPNTRGLVVAGLGYTTPYLGVFRDEVERTFALMPAPQGVVKWPSTSPSLVSLVEETQLPLPDASVDRVLAVHALEMTVHAPDMLREIWRVMAAGGRLLLVVPNRRGIWARIDTTPFGYGRPFSRRQLVELLRDALFTPVGWSEALWIPPLTRVPFLRAAVAWERIGKTMSLPFAGVHIVEATKQVWRPIPLKPARKLAPVLATKAGAAGA
ncbi:MAG TPA: methyltransferase domain-containing protein [Xanthobacteraceae bacterium]|nr:methyltransferase domain-containing protein [Xanthobacteraceae bacterium]